MIPAIVIFIYLGIVLVIGISNRGGTGTSEAEGYFLAGRGLGPAVFLLSLVGTNMTAFSILGASGHAFANGIVTYGLMASASALVIPFGLFVIGTRLWALGQRRGFITPVQMFRDRWEMGHIGTVIFVVQAVLLVPYIIIAVMGGGTVLRTVSNGVVPFWLGGAIVSLVVMGYVFFGGMRGTAWVNAFQTTLFLIFGAVAVTIIGRGMGGFSGAMTSLAESTGTSALLTRERISPLYFFSYSFIPLSSLTFPHIGIFCMTAKKLGHFKKTIVLYPICMLLIWLPSVFLGVAANRATDVPAIAAKLEARATLASEGATLAPPAQAALRAKASGDDVILRLVEGYAPFWLAALLGAAVMAAVMASDSQILALSTMFTEDIFTFYGGTSRFGGHVQVQTGRVFIVLITVVAYAIALNTPQSIFDIATQYAFAGYASLFPLLAAALFWRGSTRWGALASTVWTALAVIAVAVVQQSIPAPPPGQAITVLELGGQAVVTRVVQGALVFGLLPVVPMTLISAVLMVAVSKLTPGARPGADTLRTYFPTAA
ncbi:MAG: sodium:solute symporter family protein [Vicinamibacterales bacterium]|nr:sodium:solute symporter family protein [Vicinamibacterales bacterium]